MWFLSLVSWISSAVHICIITLSIAAFLFYLAELVEEFTVTACKIIKCLILFTMVVFVGLFLFENLPTSMLLLGFVTQIIHLFLLRTFPYFILTSPSFLSAIVMVFVNHYMAFSYFSTVYYTFSEVLAYFTICMWLVPFSFFVSLSANENVLPTFSDTKPLISDGNDVVSNYFSKKGKRYGLLSFFNYAKESILPQRVKKVF